MTDLSADHLRDLFHYDETTGTFTRRVRTSNRINVGDVAGNLMATGYVRFCVNGRAYTAHRLAWLYVHGRWPDGEIDHINGQRDDNRIANLREVSRGQNMQNLRSARLCNKAGLLGVSWDERNKKWRADIRVSGTRKNLGRYATPQEAHSEYLRAKALMHPFGTI